jgi:hypothetical protein
MNINARRRALVLVSMLSVALGGGFAFAYSGAWTTQWTSEEYQPTMCADDTVATRLECWGSNCDWVRMTCNNAPRELWGHTWTTYKSEEEGYNYCPTGYFVTGIHCHGGYCDNEALQCTQMLGAVQNSCQWVGPFSEEAPNFGQCPAGKYIQGLYCSGSNCDNQWVYCCNM